jgi:hypothetical protein
MYTFLFKIPSNPLQILPYTLCLNITVYIMLKNPPHHVGLQTSMINITIVGEIIGEGNE